MKLRLRSAGRLVMTQPVDGAAASPGVSASLPRPYKINGRFVIPWPGFKPPGAAGLVKFMANSKDESNIPSREVPVTFCTVVHTFACSVIVSVMVMQ